MALRSVRQASTRASAIMLASNTLPSIKARHLSSSSHTPTTSAGAGVGGAVFGDPRNEDVLIYLNTAGEAKYVKRAEAVVSVFDSGFILGDGVWEGLRLYNG